MNDNELDQLLDTWKAPAPTSSLRQRLRTKLPRRERRIFTRPVRWMIAIAAVSVTLAISAGQSRSNFWDFRLAQAVEPLYDACADVVPRGILDLIGLDTWEEIRIMKQIRQSSPRVYINGHLAGPLEYGHAATINVRIPGEGVYSVSTHRGGLRGWVEAGNIHGDVIEFEAGRNRVRIECNKPIVDSDRPVYVLHRP